MEAEDATADDQGDDEEEPLVPDEITDDFLEGLIVKTNSLVKELQMEQKFKVVEDVQRLLGVSQNLKRDLDNEKVRIQEAHDATATVELKLEEVKKMTEVDRETIDRLKSEIDGAWKQTDIAQAREQTSQEAMMILREKLEKLQVESEKISEKKDGMDDLGSQFGKHKESILRERDRLAAEVEELNRRLHVQRSYAEETEKKRQESEKKLKEMYKVLDSTSDEAIKEKKTLEMFKVQMAEVTSERDAREEEVRHFKSQSEQFHKQTVQLNIQLATARSNIDKLSQQLRVTNEKLSKTTTDLDNLFSLKEKLTHELNQKNNFLKLREDENKKYSIEVATLIKSREMLMKKLMLSEVIKGNHSQEILKLKNIIFTFEKERDALKKIIDQMKKDIDKVIKEREMVRKDLQKANWVIGDQTNGIMLQEQHVKNLDNEIKAHITSEHKLKGMIHKVEKERDRHSEEIQLLTEKLEISNEELAKKVIMISELKEKISQLQGKVINVQSLFETARTERNGFQKELQATIEDREEIKDRLFTTSRQVENLREEVTTKETDLSRSQKTIERLEKEKQALKVENQNILTAFQHTKTELKEKKVETERLYKTLNELEVQIGKVKKELETSIIEKDLVVQQLNRRNEEIGVLNEKNDLLQLSLDRGEAQYMKRLDDIRLLKIEIANLRSQRNSLSRGLANTADMRQEVLQLHRELTQERVRAKALEEEMTTPMNVHRWRKLEGKEPDKLDLIVKVQTLQKRLLAQTVEANEREQTIEESRKLYVSLKDLVVKLPSYEVKQRLTTTQRTLTAKTRKLKALTAEINIRHIEDKAKDMMIEDLKVSLSETKRELVKHKKEKRKIFEELEREALAGGAHQFPPIAPPPGTPGYRTVGSGFRVPS